MIQAGHYKMRKHQAASACLGSLGALLTMPAPVQLIPKPVILPHWSGRESKKPLWIKA